MYNLGDETVVAGWLENPYWQQLSGEFCFQCHYHFNQNNFVHFRKRIGEESMQWILRERIQLFSKEELKQTVKGVRIETTVQEMNIEFTTNRRLYERTLNNANAIAWKKHKKYEFGNKGSFACTRHSGIIIRAMTMEKTV